MSAPAVLKLRLYVSGQGQYTLLAQRNLSLVAAESGVKLELEVVDVGRSPDRARRDSVLVTPTLLRLAPAPRTMLIGDLSDHARVAALLGLAPGMAARAG